MHSEYREPAAVDQTASPFHAWLDHAEARALVDRSLLLSPGERLTLAKGLVPGLVTQMGLAPFGGFLAELTAEARRYDEAGRHPGQGRETRREPGEPLGGPTPAGHRHLPEFRHADGPGSRAAERARETALWKTVADVGGAAADEVRARAIPDSLAEHGAAPADAERDARAIAGEPHRRPGGAG